MRSGANRVTGVTALVLVAVCATAALAGCSVAARPTGGSEVSIPVAPQAAVAAARTETRVAGFVNARFEDPSLVTTEAALIWDESASAYRWRVEISERECGCKGEARIDAVRAFVDPVTGKVLSVEVYPAIKEGEYARKTCGRDCHGD